MKKIKFLAKTRDKYTKDVYEIGEEIEVSNERAEEILKARGKDGKALAEQVEQVEQVETATVETEVETAVVKKKRKKKKDDV